MDSVLNDGNDKRDFRARREGSLLGEPLVIYEEMGLVHYAARRGRPTVALQSLDL